MRTCFLARTPKRVCVCVHIYPCVFVECDAMLGMCFFRVFRVVLCFFPHKKTPETKTHVYVAFKTREVPKTRMYIPFDPRKRICALGFERPRRKCTCVFYHNHSKVEKNDFPQLRTLKKELCMHFRTPRCCSLFPVTWLLLKRLSCNVCCECIQLETFHCTVLAKRKKGVKSREFRLLTPRKKS